MSRLVLVVLSLAVAMGCGSSVAPSTAPPPAGSGSPGTSVGLVATSPPAGVPGTSRRTDLPCADVMVAWEQASVMLDVLSNLTTDEEWAVALAPDSPIRMDPEALDGWIDQLASLAGQSDTIQVMRQVIPLLRAAVRSGKPYSEASGVGMRLLDAARDANSLARVEIATALEIRGCTGV